MEDPLEKEMATHSSILAWRIPWTEEPGRLQSTVSQRGGHDWALSLHFTSVLNFYYSVLSTQVLTHIITTSLFFSLSNVLTVQLTIESVRRSVMSNSLWPQSPSGSSVHGIFQARILEWVTIPFSRGYSWARNQTQVSHIADRFFTIWVTREGWCKSNCGFALLIFAIWF